VCAPRTNAGAEVMSWIADEYSDLQKDARPAAVGMPPQAGGLAEREKIIGHAISVLAQCAATDEGMPISGLRVAVRSLDQSGFYTARALQQMGYVIVAISEQRGGVRCSTGIDTEELAAHLSHCG